MQRMKILGIETSCDETAAAIVTDRPDPQILGHCIHAQFTEHRPYGGVVPEIAARAHLDHLDGVIRRTLDEAGTRRLELEWRESGGPPVTPRRRRGFGSRLIERSLSRELQGEVTLEFAPAGLVCRVAGLLAEAP